MKVKGLTEKKVARLSDKLKTKLPAKLGNALLAGSLLLAVH